MPEVQDLIKGFVTLVFVWAIISTLASELGTTPFINVGLFNLMIFVLFIAFIIEVLRRFRILR